ncbi:hypothetical protein NIES2101_22520 [Calothrix sp. HK-06]|nr:hypothetical protein NIES2101_22520 [Calothrix sp. HK-06]
MKNTITRKLTSEDEELNKKLIELAALEAELTERELELATFQSNLHTFEREYLRVVGVRYAELDEIEYEIAKYLTYLKPKDSNARRQVEKAWTRAQNSKRAASENFVNQEFSRDFKPWESLKKLYREVAKCIHPDLATDEVERQRRQQLMTEVNLAYENGDEEQLKTILQGWKNSPEFVQCKVVAAELTRIIRKIAQVKERLKVIEGEIEDLKKSELNQLREKILTAQEEGRDLLIDMASHIDEQIATAKLRLKELKAKVRF